MKKPWVVRVSVLLALSFALAGRGPLAATPASSWEGFVNHFIAAYFVAHPDFAVEAGRHEFDGKLPDWSPAALSKEAERLRSARRQAKERLRAYIAYAKAVPAAVEHIRNNLRTPLPRTYLEVGRIVFGGLASYYEVIPGGARGLYPWQGPVVVHLGA